MTDRNQALCRAKPFRVIPKLTIHGEPINFRELCRRSVPKDADYLVLDVDHTTHLHRNLGELLGWEICAEEAYGSDTLDQINAQRALWPISSAWASTRRDPAIPHDSNQRLGGSRPLLSRLG